ncbi:Hypothetical protein NocV09_01801390 [Nannochloropsis oceanica]
MTGPRISSFLSPCNNPPGGGAVCGPLVSGANRIEGKPQNHPGKASSFSSSSASSCGLISESLLTSAELDSTSLALESTLKGKLARQGQSTMQAVLSSRRRSTIPPTRATRATVATALASMVVLAVVLLRKSRVGKGRLVELLAATVGGLLSSSCCAVQLVLNSISVGCAGFAVLDRFRPLFLFLTFSSLAYKTVTYDIQLHKKPLRSLPTWLVAVALASAPVLVRRLNRGELSMGSFNLASSLHGTTPRPVMLRYRVRGMKCEACANGLKNALEAMGDLRADVIFEQGMVFLVADVATATEHRDGMTEGETAAASVLQTLEQGVADVMHDRGYSYHSL